ncbi:malto-oligosyltrehalose trehalohydrolase [bacterium F11]|nr:malto-oligosyltrehalose trehalohydrolase [bacterium F11]
MKRRFGASQLSGDCCHFSVWAPQREKVDLIIEGPKKLDTSLKRGSNGYFQAEVENVTPGSTYFYLLDGKVKRPDPASQYQPDGVHGPSQVVDPSFAWEDQHWKGIPLKDYLLYELHVGLFTKEGTFESLIHHLPYFKELGITALEIMPVAQFPGQRNWGYDGVYPYATQNSYGGPNGFKKLINACHKEGLAVVLDVVYNHIGPEGNYLGDFGPFFTEKYKTPWGRAINFDGPYSDDVRRYFIENALMWVDEFHIDGLRLDAVHAIYDFSGRTFLEELGEAIQVTSQKSGRHIYPIAESDLNDSRIIRPKDQGGYNLASQWCDDFHHALHTLLTKEKSGYYVDFGAVEHLQKSFENGYVYSGDYSPFRKRKHGNSTEGLVGSKFVVFNQNHDQIGNRMMGDRLSETCSLEVLKLAASSVIFSPFIPLFFMGEEYLEKAPFQYFVHHSDKDLIEAVRKGRKEEFESFQWKGMVPDPQDEDTFLKCKLNHDLRKGGPHGLLFEFYKHAIGLRKSERALNSFDRNNLETDIVGPDKVLLIHRWDKNSSYVGVFNFAEDDKSISHPMLMGEWESMLNTADKKWGGNAGSSNPSLVTNGKTQVHLNPHSFVLLKSIHTK